MQRETEARAYLQQMQPLLELWALIDRQVSAEHALALTPAHTMIGAHIEHLQALYRGALGMQVPHSCRAAHRAFLAAIGATIGAYLVTADQVADEPARRTLLGAMHAYHRWQQAIASLSPVEQN